jgi:AraC family transcriptional regulator
LLQSQHMPEPKTLGGIAPLEKIISQNLFRSDFYEIKNWAFDYRGERKINEGYNDCFCIVFVKKGNFLLDLSSKTYDMHTGHMIVEKPDYEYRLRPAAGECSILNFTDAFYEQLVDDYGLKKTFFFSNESILSLLVKTSAEIDYLHYQILKQVGSAGKLEIDNLVLELVQQIVECITNKTLDVELPSSLRRNHMTTVENAKEYMNENFPADISLQDLAAHCCVSPFHFSRTFKKFTGYSPHQYLLNIRLKHAEMLVRNTSLPIADVCFSSGFNSIEYFATAFRQKFRMNPTQYRKE